MPFDKLQICRYKVSTGVEGVSRSKRASSPCAWGECDFLFQLVACIMNTTDELATWISNGDVAIFFSRIWTRSGLIRGDPKFGQGLEMSPLYR